jgi:hypothetical protein
MNMNGFIKICQRKTAVIFIITTVAILLGYSCHLNQGKAKSSSLNSAADTAIISFTEYEHDFGKVAEGEKVACTFTFVNKGAGPLMLSSVTTTCGCTVAKYDTKPISPGNSGTVEIVFDSSGKSGKQTKTITINSNASKPIVLLKITGEVLNSSNN